MQFEEGKSYSNHHIFTRSLALRHPGYSNTLPSLLPRGPGPSLFVQSKLTCFFEVFNLRFKLLLAAYSSQIVLVISCASCDFRLGTCVPVSNLQISVSLPMLYSRISALQPCALHISLYAGHRLNVVSYRTLQPYVVSIHSGLRIVSFRVISYPQ